MFTLVRALSFRDALVQVPVLLASLGVAETLYKLHSFTLECVAFLATWYVADALASRLTRPTRPAGR
jgi:hypothetical protein